MQRRALVVDDESGVLRFVTEVLERQGYSVTPAASGSKALQLCLSENRLFDVLVTDIVMPGMSGPALVQTLAEHGIDIPVLFMSGFDGTSLREKTPAEICAQLLIKPFTPYDLVSAVEDAMARNDA